VVESGAADWILPSGLSDAVADARVVLVEEEDKKNKRRGYS
jgi:hypothetical protein